MPYYYYTLTYYLLRSWFFLRDTSGQGRFSTVIKSYSRGAEGILLVYDITNRWSFDGIRRWLTEIEFVRIFWLLNYIGL